MLWYCRFRWQPNTRLDEVRRRVLEQHDAGALEGKRIRGWYNLAGGGAGFLLLDAETPREVTDLLEPYMDLVDWDVHAVYELNYEQVINDLRQKVPAA